MKATFTTRRNLIVLIAAFAAVYIIWGSTYLAIKYAIETIPTFLMAGIRFTVAGAILYAWSRFSAGYERPTLAHWRASLILGTLLLAIGNGAVVLAEHYISSSLAALLIATTPFWIVLLSWGFMGTGRPNHKVAAGLAVGFVGVSLLILGRGPDGGNDSGGQAFGIIATLVATVAWSAGSLYGTRSLAVTSAVQSAGMQMLAGGAVLLMIGTITGEWSTFDPTAVSTTSALALAYLIVFGAVVAFTAFSWLLRNASPEAVSTYAYVNPAIAVLLGWAVAGESLTGLMLAGAAVVVVSVALITANKGEKRSTRDEDIDEVHNSHLPTAGGKTLSATA
ncbi:MAG: EamA family transporter [Pyrinomonadaceae bacterium]